MDDTTGLRHGLDYYPLGSPMRLGWWLRVWRAWRHSRHTIKTAKMKPDAP